MQLVVKLAVRAYTSISFHLESGTGAIVRCKQFLYDVGPISAVDCAALFDYQPEAMRAWPLGEGRLAWTGFDYENRPAVSMLAWGTNFELRVAAGDVSKQDLLALARSTAPTAPANGGKPLPYRTYWSRYPRYDQHMCRYPNYRPPSSIWRIRGLWFHGDHSWTTHWADCERPGAGRRTLLAFRQHLHPVHRGRDLRKDTVVLPPRVRPRPSQRCRLRQIGFVAKTTHPRPSRRADPMQIEGELG